eukprot:6197847-Pleurochrysis_carterae.AAC.2
MQLRSPVHATEKRLRARTCATRCAATCGLARATSRKRCSSSGSACEDGRASMRPSSCEQRAREQTRSCLNGPECADRPGAAHMTKHT